MTSPAKLELVGRPSLMLPPSFAAAVEEEEEDGDGKFEYKFYSPLKKSKESKIHTPKESKIHTLLKKTLTRSMEDEDVVEEQDVIRFHSNGGQKELSLMQNKDNNWVGSSHGWLVLFNKTNRNMSLINPVSGRRILLPPLGAEPIKVILSHSPDDEKCRALVIHGKYYNYSRAAAFCSPGRSARWSPLALGRGCWYSDFVYSASQRCFVSAKRVSTGLGFGRPVDELEFWDAQSGMKAPLRRAVRAPPPAVTGSEWQTYLVSEEEDPGRLFLVRRFLSDGKKTRVGVGYEVYKIVNYFGSDYVKLCETSLEDLVMFIGMNHCFAVKASRFPEYRPNCIYFSGGWNPNKPFADVYDYGNSSFLEAYKAYCYCYYDDRKYYSQLFHSTSSSSHEFPFDHNLPWFTLTKD